MKQTKVSFNREGLQSSYEILYALAHPVRLRILQYLDEQREDIPVSRIYNSLGIEQSVTSQHLRIMKMADILHARKKGKFVFYKINYPVVERAHEAVQNTTFTK